MVAARGDDTARAYVCANGPFGQSAFPGILDNDTSRTTVHWERRVFIMMTILRVLLLNKRHRFLARCLLCYSALK